MQLLRELSRLQHEHGWLSEATLRELAEERRVPLYRLEGLVSFYPHFRREPPKKTVVHLCRDVCCAMAGGEQLAAEVRAKRQAGEEVEFHDVSCLGRCDAAPAVAVDDIPVAASDAETLLGFIHAPETLTEATSGVTPIRWNCDPYADGLEPYSVVKDLLQSDGDLGDVCIDRLQAAGLRGMGGAGFPTARKWGFVRDAESRGMRPAGLDDEPAGLDSDPAGMKHVICNADESEPGTFKDRVILEELPHLVIEGMLLAALTVGAEGGIVYIRHEYAREQQSLEKEIDRARRLGVLGENAAGSGQRFDIEVFVSPGGYILGEETALLEALEDKRGEPRNRPPYPGEQGLWGQPTLVNNVETFALATGIIHHGPDWWRAQGREGHSGLKVVSVSGDVQRPGVYEIPLGMTVRELVDLAGGMRDGTRLLAFLPGGASSNFLPAEKADTPLDFDAMQQAGSMLGTGAVIVIAEGRDLFALATNLVRFFRNESCGKCVPCRLGSEQAVELLDGVRAGSVPRDGLDILPELGETLLQTSICGLGQVALNPVLSMLQHFPDHVPETPAAGGQ